MKIRLSSFFLNNLLCVLCFLLLVSFGFSCKEKQKPPDFKKDASNTVLFKHERPELEVLVKTARLSSFQRFIESAGVVSAGNTFAVNSPLAGRVVMLPVEEGMNIRRDQVIVELDNEQILLDLQRQLAVVEYQKERLKNLQESADYNDSEERELLHLIQAEDAQLKILEKRLENTRTKSPITGRISRLLVQEEEVIPKGAPLATIVDLSKVTITADVDREDLQYLKKGARTEIRLEQDSRQVFLGVITRISLEADPQTHRFTFEVTVANFEEKFLPGMTAWIKIRGQFIKDVLTVPDSATIERDGEYYVFVLMDGHAELRKVAIGWKAGEKWIVSSGLKEGERVIISQVEQLQDGDPVVIVSE